MLHVCSCLQRPEENIFPGAGVTGSGEPPDTGVENPAVVQEEHQVFLTTEPSLQYQVLCLISKISS